MSDQLDELIAMQADSELIAISDLPTQADSDVEPTQAS